MNKTSLSLVLGSILLASGCAMLEPRLPEAQPQIAADWPLPPVTNTAPTTATAGDETVTTVQAADIGWRDFFVDDKLEQLIALSLDNNRDLRTAILNVEKARAMYRIQRADRFPSLGASAQMERTGSTLR